MEVQSEIHYYLIELSLMAQSTYLGHVEPVSYLVTFLHFRGHPRAVREGEVLRQFQDFREKFWSKFWISLYILYIFTSLSAQEREVSQLKETFSPKSPSKITPV